MRRRITALLFALAAVIVTTAQQPEPPANADKRRLFLPIVARNALADRGPMTRWTAYARTRFNDLVVDANGIVFASTDDGVLRWDSASATGEHRWLTEADGVPAGPIGALALDAAGNLWLAAKPTETIADADATKGVRRLARDGTWRDFTTADGLAGNAVYAIEVDREGRVWVAAWHGVSRQEADGAWTALRNPNPFVMCHGVDCVHTKLAIAFGGGVTWFGHAGGVTRLDADGQWYEYATHPVRRIAVDRVGGAWYPEQWGFSVVHHEPTGEGVHHVDLPSRIGNGRADLVFDAADRLWVGVRDRVESVGADGQWRAEGGPNGLPTDGLSRLSVDPAGRVWAALGGALHLVEVGGPTLRVGLPLAGDNVYVIAPAADGSMWLGVADTGSPLGGLVRVGPDGRWTSRGLQAGHTDATGVWQVVFGPDGTLWARDGQRLLQRRPDGTETVHESRTFDPRAHFDGLVLDGDGTLWTAIRGADEPNPADGIAALSIHGRWRHFLLQEGGMRVGGRPLAYDAVRHELWFRANDLAVRGADGSWRMEDVPDGTVASFVRSMLVDGDGGRWFIVGGGDLWFLSPDGRWIDRTEDIGFSPDERPVVLHTLAADPDGGIWCGTERGLVRLNIDGRWQRIAIPFAHPDDAWQVVRSLAFDGAERLWVGTDAGVARLE